MDKSVQITTIVVLGVVVLGLILAYSTGNLNPSNANTISVSGTGSIMAIPDLVTVYFSVETKGSTSEEATSLNSDIVSDLKKNLISSGFSSEDIKTQGFNVYPNYEWNGQRQTQSGYIASHTLILRLPAEEYDKIGTAVDSGVEAGAGISYINFELSQEKQNEYKAEAMKLAAQDARIKAESVAEGFDKDLGSLLSTSVNDFGYYPWLAYEARDGSSVSEVKEAATNIQPSEQEITASVTAVYKMR